MEQELARGRKDVCLFRSGALSATPVNKLGNHPQTTLAEYACIPLTASLCFRGGRRERVCHECTKRALCPSQDESNVNIITPKGFSAASNSTTIDQEVGNRMLFDWTSSPAPGSGRVQENSLFMAMTRAVRWLRVY